MGCGNMHLKLDTMVLSQQWFVLCCTFSLVSLQLCHASRASAEQRVDFIIVGGGTSGCVLAGRMCAALPNAKIVVVERGKERNATEEFLVRSPRFPFEVRNIDTVSESWQSLPNDGLMGNQVLMVTGKTLGGSSSINGMQWSIPLEGTIQKWNIEGLSEQVAKKFYRHAYKKVQFSQQPQRLRQIYATDFIKASIKAGFPNKFAPFDQKTKVKTFDHSVAITKTGRRIDSCTAYVSPVLKGACKKNLRILQGVTVTKLLFNEDTPKRTVGIEYVSSTDLDMRGRKVMFVNKEVLLAAGPYGSPKTLQLSGIGPMNRLRNSGVKVHTNLGVGMRTQGRTLNFVTSVYAGVPLEPSNNSTILNSERTRKRWEAGKASVFGSNPASVINVLGQNGYTFFATAASGEGIDVPLLTSFCLNNPKSFGTLLIKDRNPFTSPNVQLNLLNDMKELKRLRNCLQKMRTVHKALLPSFKVTISSPKNRITENFLRRTSAFGDHFVGGCSVGKVLERNLTVRGIAGLRVIDASALKTIPTSSGPLASVYMLAEYASEKLIQLYRQEFKIIQR